MGMFYTAYSVTQMISVYCMGSWSDKYGRKLFLILSLFGSFTGPLLQSFSKSMLVMNIFRAYTGLLAGSVTIGQASIADLFPPEKRGSYFSYLLGISSSAYVIGPAIGGALGAISLQMPFWVSAEEESQEIDSIKEQLDGNNKKIIRFMNECISVILASYYGLFIINVIKATSIHYTVFLCSVGIAAALIQIIFLPLFKDKLHFNVVYIAIIGSIIMLIGTVVATFPPSPWYAAISGFIIFAGFSFINPISVMVLSVQSPPECQGKALSAATIVSQSVYIIIPLVYGSFYDKSPFWSICSTNIFAILIALVGIFTDIKKATNEKK
ncbi:hypothetical protein WA158_001970 [Blastocystis sp. Blastoise]